MKHPRLIKKYANRRLYDTTASRHVTLADIRDLIVSGVNVKIVDDTRDTDITRALLLQIIVEREQAGEPLLPELLLTQLIRFYGSPMQHMMGDYLQQSVSAFVSQQQTFQTQMRDAISATPMATLQQLMQRNLGAWETLLGGTPDEKPSRTGDTAPARPDTSHDEDDRADPPAKQ